MKFELIPGVLALSLVASFPAAAQDEGAESPAAETSATDAEAEAEEAAPPADPAEVKTSSSYGLGYRSGGEFAQRYGSFGITPADLETDTFFEGFLDGMKGNDPSVSEEELGAAMQAFGEMLQQREQELAAENLKAGKAFLEANAKRDEVTVTDSGLQYEILDEGGDKKYEAPKEGEPQKQFMVHYKGTLPDETVFDQSPEGETVPMTLQVIEGFKEALTMMPIGARWKLYIPSELAYGDQRRSADIGPNSVLIFELELVSIEDAPAAGGGMPFPMPQGE